MEIASKVASRPEQSVKKTKQKLLDDFSLLIANDQNNEAMRRHLCVFRSFQAPRDLHGAGLL